MHALFRVTKLYNKISLGHFVIVTCHSFSIKMPYESRLYYKLVGSIGNNFFILRLLTMLGFREAWIFE